MITLRPHQIAAADAVEDAFRFGITRPLMDACVGSGKSLIYGELARRAIMRGERVLICAHTRELVKQNASACRALGLQTGINAAALDERTWRAPVISAAVQSIFRNASSFGPISLLCIDESHLIPHAEGGMYRELHRALGYPRMVGGSGTPFRLQGGSLVQGEGAPFEKIVYRYGIMDGIRDGYLVAPYSVRTDDRLDPAKLKTRQGEYTGESQDAQMFAMMDNHIAQMLHHGRDRKAWLVFEASDKAVRAMAQRMNEWGIPTGFVLSTKSRAESIRRDQAIHDLASGKLRALVSMNALTTGYDEQRIDMLVCRRRTKSLSLWIQIVGRLLRTIGGNIDASMAAGKADGLLLDFADNTAEFGPLDWIRPKDTAARLASCDECGKRNQAAAMHCWACDAPMTKLCPACLVAVVKGTLDCPHCDHDMRAGERGPTAGPKLLDTPSGAALISAFRPRSALDGGWVPIRKAWSQGDVTSVVTEQGDAFVLPAPLVAHAVDARWIRVADGELVGLLVPNGANRTSVRQYSRGGELLIVPMPSARQDAA